MLSFAKTYYVSNAGNDSNSGITKLLPWKTFTHVNDRNFIAGDSILLKRGYTFFGTMLPMNDSRGVSGNPVVFSSYGVGNTPIITGFTSITEGWTNEGGGIYSKSVTCQSNPNIITINGKQYAMGRFPNASTTLTNYTASNYLSVDSHVSNISITDADLNSSVTNWTGAKMVLRGGYVLDRCTITGHSGTTITYTNHGSRQNAVNGYYYFIEDDLRTLDQFGEWYYDGTKLYVYFGGTTPTNYTIKVPSLDRLFDIASHYSSYITVQNLSFTGANVEIIRVNSDPYVTVDNCTLDFSGGSGIYFSSNYGVVNNCSLNHISRTAIWCVNGTNNTITRNTIKNTGLLEGSVDEGSYSIPIMTMYDDYLIQYNRIDSCAKGGILFSGNRTQVKNNFVSNTHFTMSDGGAINTGGLVGIDPSLQQVGKVIQDNICIGGWGKSPITGHAPDFAIGIYCDEESHDVLVKGNTVANYSNGGIALFLSKASSISIQNNTFYNNKVGINLSETSATHMTIDNAITGNIVLAKSSDQLIMQTYSRYNTIIPFGTSDNNYFTRPIDDNNIVLKQDAVNDGGAFKNMTLAQWNDYSSQDANTQKSPVTITNENDFQFEYNATQSPIKVSLSKPMIDVKDMKYASSVTIQPYTSVVLMKDNNPATYFTEYKSICEGANYNSWTTTGTYERTLISKSGADSIVTTNLIVNPTYSISEDIIINEGEEYNGWTTSGQYSRTFPSVAGCDSTIITNLTVESLTTKQAEIIPTHFIPVWQGENGLNHMNILVVSASLEDLPLAADDEIAVFDGSICVGSMKLSVPINSSDNTTFLTISASQNDGSNNGFTENDTIIIKIWDNLNQKEIVANAVTYRNEISSWITSGKYAAGATSVVELVSFVEYSQTIELVQGYNLISSYVTAPNPDVSVVTQSLCEQGSLVKIQDEAGNTLENWGSFGGWINKVGSIENTEGYKIKVANDCVLQITGRPIALPLDIPLKTGWNIISFPRTDLVDAMSIIQPLIDQNTLIKVQDETGNSIENWGIFGGWKNGIGNFIPGKAYKVKLSADAILTIQEHYTKSAVILANRDKTTYFLSRIEGHGSDHMNINLVGLQESGISVGDELAAFDGTICVGSLKITENDLIEGSASLIVSFSTDNQNNNGFTEGHVIELSAWSQMSGDEFIVQTDVVSGQFKYSKNSSVLVKLKSLTTGIKSFEDKFQIDVFPNPSQGRFTVRFSEMPEAGSRIDILDLSGRKIASRMVGGMNEEFNLDHQPAGIYLVKSIIDSSETIHKLIVN